MTDTGAIVAHSAGIAVLILLSLFGGCSSSGDDDDIHGSTSVPNPTITQVTGGRGWASGGMRYDVSQFGYEEREYFFEGEAKTYPADGSRAPYRSRMIVWTPSDPSRFNGTTVVEWAQVSDFGQFELTVALNFQSSMLEDKGFAFVLVSAEEGGICDQGSNGCSPMSLKNVDPERYGALNHPGDNYSFDIFNQALQAIKYPQTTSVLGDLRTRFVIAEGFQPSIDKWFPIGAPDSSSASPFGIYGPLNAYLANGADDDARLADAFLIDAAAPAVEPVSYRVPTLHHLDESAIRRASTADSPNHVTWEVAGAPHTDRWMTDHTRLPSSQATNPSLSREEEEARRDQYDNFGQIPDSGAEVCTPGRTTGSIFPRRFTLNAALVALHQWLNEGIPAPSAPRIERVGPIPETPTAKLARDTDGNALGGLRLPIIEVPVASYYGEACVETGTTTALPSERLAGLYATHRSYVERLATAVNDAVQQRFLLCHDAATIMRKASVSSIGGSDEFVAEPECL